MKAFLTILFLATSLMGSAYASDYCCPSLNNISVINGHYCETYSSNGVQICSSQSVPKNAPLPDVFVSANIEVAYNGGRLDCAYGVGNVPVSLNEINGSLSDNVGPDNSHDTWHSHPGLDRCPAKNAPQDCPFQLSPPRQLSLENVL